MRIHIAVGLRVKNRYVISTTMATLHMINMRYSVAVVTDTTFNFCPMMEPAIYVTSSDVIKVSFRKGGFVQNSG